MEREEAIKIVKSHYPANKQMLNEALEFLIPELKESEDERIRKEIIAFIKKRDRSGCDYDYDKWISWLEKQGGQREQLINKACDVLVNCIEDFMSRRMEIWDEECKKQTLENIRKTLEK